MDEREVEPMKLRRSVGAEVNWGIRFTSDADAEDFLDGIAGTISTYLNQTHKHTPLHIYS